MKMIVCGLLLALCVVAQDPPQKPPGIPACEPLQRTASGLQWCELAKGRDEAPPGPEDVVEVHYTGWLTDGTKFDSSRDGGQPAKFPLNGVIAGWTEGLQLMAPGARWKFVIPPELGYGADGAPPAIPPAATLVFDVELLRVTRMPKLRPANPAAQHKGDDGVVVEVVAPGTGAMCGPKDGVNLRFAVWRADGSLFDCSERHDDARLSGTPATLQFVFLREPVQKCNVGGILRLEVPRALFPNAEADTIWEIELTSVTAVPPFRACDPAKTVTTQSGLQYEVIELGQGDPPRASDTVVAFYTGWLTDGTMFDSAHVRGTPSEFPLNRVVRGWTEGLQLMKPGAKFLFTIPPDLAYGARGKPPTIPANATLVFLIELVAVKRK